MELKLKYKASLSANNTLQEIQNELELLYPPTAAEAAKIRVLQKKETD